MRNYISDFCVINILNSFIKSGIGFMLSVYIFLCDYLNINIIYVEEFFRD